jgi:putative spermidine/putrescine transport system ATP-binding protein
MTTWSIERLSSRLDRFELGPIDLELAPGRAVAVLGNSGAGKTTLLRTLAGFVPAVAGRVLRDGVDITDRSPERRGLGYVPQGLGLFAHRTVERNVSYPLEMRAAVDALARTRPLLERFGLAPLARRYPARLSGGELERVALARALAADPELVLWDEPWQGLDVEARYELGRVFEDLRDTERVPVVVVTHDPALAFSVADSFLVLRAGRVVFRGATDALLRRPFDTFTARFVGYENVYDASALAPDASALAPGGPGSLAAWLRQRAGPEGIAFARPEARLGLAAEGGEWEAVVRGAHPAPDGVELTARVEGLSVLLRLPSPLAGALPTVGSRVRFGLEEMSVHPLGAPGDGETGRFA